MFLDYCSILPHPRPTPTGDDASVRNQANLSASQFTENPGNISSVINARVKSTFEDTKSKRGELLRYLHFALSNFRSLVVKLLTNVTGNHQADVYDIAFEPFGSGDFGDKALLGNKIPNVVWAIAAPTKPNQALAGRVDQAVLYKKLSKQPGDFDECWGLINLSLGDASQTSAEFGELGFPRRSDKALIRIDHLELFQPGHRPPAHQTNGPFNNLVGPVPA